MKTIDNNSLMKGSYSAPAIECIKLDNDISLQLASDPGTPDSGDEVYNTPHYLNNDPYKSNLG